MYLLVVLGGGMLVKAQPPPDLDPEDTEAIIAAFLDNAATQQWDDMAVNDVLEQILRQDAAPGESSTAMQEAGASMSSQTDREKTPVTAPYHGVNSPISTPTQADEDERRGRGRGGSGGGPLSSS